MESAAILILALVTLALPFLPKLCRKKTAKKSSELFSVEAPVADGVG
ncbi:MAG TPA: hypothetical protein VEL68_02385 [Thermodesulfobacteriota bacterium]|nr:hypothetical protein [Thermodesulfobacteriota bacterium]